MRIDITKVRVNKTWTDVAPSGLESVNLDKVKGAYIVLTKSAYGGWDVYASSANEDEMFALHELLMLATNAPKVSVFARLDVQSFGPGILPDEYFPSDPSRFLA